MINDFDDILNFNLFKGLTVEEVGKFLINCDYYIEKYNPLEKILAKDNYIMFVMKGDVKKSYIDKYGNVTVTNFYFYKAENIINIDMGEDYRFINYNAISPATILFVSLTSMKSFIPEIEGIKSKIYNNMLDTFTFAMRKNEIIDVFLSQTTIREKILAFIDYQKNPPKGLDKFGLTKANLADMLKVDYSSLCREVKILSEEIPYIEEYISLDNRIT